MLSPEAKFPSVQDIQDKNFQEMSADKKIRLALLLNSLLRKIAEDSIKEQYPQADDLFIKERLRERMEP
jgi:hypothetical protein